MKVILVKDILSLRNEIENNLKRHNTYKFPNINNISNPRIVSMSPSDLMVAGCLHFFRVLSIKIIIVFIDSNNFNHNIKN